MATSGKFCPWCGRENPEDAEACVFCGTPLTGHEGFDETAHEEKPGKPLWRRRGIQAGLVLVVVAAAGVGIWLGMAGRDEPGSTGQGEDITNASSTSAADTVTTQATVVLPDPGPVAATFGETVEFWGTSMTLSAPDILEAPEVQALVGGDVDVYVVLVTITNTADELRDYNLFYWEATDDEGATYEASLYLEDQALDSGDIQPGETVTGYVGFELPKGMLVASVTYSPMLADETAIWTR